MSKKKHPHLVKKPKMGWFVIKIDMFSVLIAGTIGTGCWSRSFPFLLTGPCVQSICWLAPSCIWWCRRPEKYLYGPWSTHTFINFITKYYIGRLGLFSGMVLFRDLPRHFWEWQRSPLCSNYVPFGFQIGQPGRFKYLLALLSCVNLIAVWRFLEIEFWFGMIQDCHYF